jgi:hypothetical protein
MTFFGQAIAFTRDTGLEPSVLAAQGERRQEAASGGGAHTRNTLSVVLRMCVRPLTGRSGRTENIL